ncbi:MAG TPA: queuosine precursor transporter [Thermoanaerobaculia bacterium]
MNRTYKYYDFVMAAFVTVLLTANIIGAAKIVNVGGFNFGAGILFFPLSYIFGDILTEVYGYARARKVVWAGFAALFYASIMSWVIVKLPPAPDWPGQEVYEAAFGSTWRISLASIVAFWCGEFSNSFTLAKMKIFTAGKHLWSRTIGSTVVGEAVDSLIFYPLAFVGVWTGEQVVQVMIANYLLKCAWEIVNTPVTYKIVGFLKRAEHEDYYDRDTNFTPFTLET